MERQTVQPPAERGPALLTEAAMGVLALTSVCLSFYPDSTTTQAISWGIWGVFIVEYLFRLLRAPRRVVFIRANLFDLVAVLPIDLLRAFRLVRLLRVLQLFRGVAVLRRVSNHIAGILRTNGLAYVLVGTASLVVGAGFLISRLEPGIGTYGDGIWWSLVTATTVGYGDLSPETNEGRLVAAVLMLVGVGMIGMITGSISTYFIGHTGARDPHIRHIQKQLDNWGEMTEEERLRVADVLRTLVDERTHK